MTLYKLVYLPLFLLLVTLGSTVAQPLSQQALTISGKVISADSLSPIEDVHIINKQNGKVWLSQQDGTFTIQISQHDTLFFSAVGFEEKEMAFSVALLDKQRKLQVKLTPQTYELDQVTIRPYPTLEQFKQEFLSLKLPPKAGENIVIPGLDANSLYDPSTNGLGPTLSISGPVSAIYNTFSRRERAHRRSKVLEQTLTNNHLAGARYNDEVVKKITGLQGDELNAFMKFCTMPNAFILTATEYELHASIHECYIAFLQTKAPAAGDSTLVK